MLHKTLQGGGVFLILISSPLWAETSSLKVAQKAEPSTVVVVPYDDEGIVRGEGSGFFV
jgi:hypothetical protein